MIGDFSSGFQPPERVKVRPVVVISPRRRVGQIATVVPLSSTAPQHVEPWHILLPSGLYPQARGPMRVKCDVAVTVAVARLDRVNVRDRAGKRSYEVFQAGAPTLAAIRMTSGTAVSPVSDGGAFPLGASSAGVAGTVREEAT